MAAKGWMTQVAAAAGVAAGAGAAQLGLGYGLGVVVWPTTLTTDDSVWLGSLGWATWIAASSTVLGAVIAGRLSRGPVGPWRFALAASAAVGALLTVALIALPARAAVRPDTLSPQTIAGGYALLGVIMGLVIAYWAVVSRSAAANLIATATWLWVLAAAAVVLDVFWHRPSATYLASWQFAASHQGGMIGAIYWPSALLTLLAAFVIGVLGAWSTARRKNFGIGTASSGAVGPLLVAGAFLVLAPRLTGTVGSLGSAYLIAPYAVLAGLAGSALTVAVARRLTDRSAGAAGQDQVVTGRAKPPASSSVPAPRTRASTVTPPPSVPKVAQINPPGPAPAAVSPEDFGDESETARVAAVPATKAGAASSGPRAAAADKAAPVKKTTPAKKAPAKRVVSAAAPEAEPDIAAAPARKTAARKATRPKPPPSEPDFPA